jgi:hypothetical protein
MLEFTEGSSHPNGNCWALGHEPPDLRKETLPVN